MTTSALPRPRSRPIHFLAAFATGGLLALMVHSNGELARYGNPLFSSWIAHGTGTAAALAMLAVWSRSRGSAAGAGPVTPFWAYLGGISGAATVMLSSAAVNTPLGLSGTLALGLAGQVVFSLAADRWGLFGLPKRRPDLRDLCALALVAAGSGVIILAARAGP
jgi:transporter family-2 protein